MAWRPASFIGRNDVSDNKLGNRCEGDCGSDGNPWGISVLEMNFRQDPLLHWGMWQVSSNYPDKIRGIAIRKQTA